VISPRDSNSLGNAFSAASRKRPCNDNAPQRLNSVSSSGYYQDIEMEPWRYQVAITKKPEVKRGPKAPAFIDAPEKTAGKEDQNGKKPVLLRFSPETLARIDRAAKRTIVSRAAFIYSSIAEKLERMEA
jgi:hypothetical protein